MLSDITLGQFFPGKSLLHRLDPRIKIIIAVIYIVGIFLADSISGFLLITVFTLALIFISRISFKTIAKGMKPVSYTHLDEAPGQRFGFRRSGYRTV